MLHALTLVLAAAFHVQVETQVASSRDSIEAARDSARHARRERRREQGSDVLRARKTRTPLTAALLANAYRDATAREIVTRARSARLAQDSSLIAYDARTLQRISAGLRSEEHTSELQSQSNLVCRLLLEKKKKKKYTYTHHIYQL